MSATISGAWEGHVTLPQVGTSRARWVAIGLVGAVGLCLPAWNVLTGLLSDSYMTLYAGRWIAAHGIPHHEVFTVAGQGRRWIDQQWLAELIDFETWRIGGYGLLGLLNGLVIGSSFAILAALVLRRGASVVLTTACCVLAAIMALPDLFIRAQDLAIVLFALLLVLCLTDAEHEQPRLRLVLIVPLLALWGNLHGSVLLGVGLACAYLAYRGAGLAVRGERSAATRCWALVMIAALTPLATPYGVHIVTYYRDLIGNPAVAAAAPENRPPRLSDPMSLAFFVPLGLSIVALIVSVAKRQRLPLPIVGAAVATAVATIFASRNVVWFGMTAAVLLACAAQQWLPTAPPSRRFLTGMVAVAAGVAALGVGLLLAPAGGYEKYTPSRALAVAAAYEGQHPGALILGDNAAASALIWHDPQVAGRVGYDARLERYAPRSLYRWIAFQVAVGPGWRATTRGYQLLIGSTKYNPALVGRLASSSGTSVLAHDALGIVVLSRDRGAQPRP